MQYEFEEEEFTTQFNGGTLVRILAQAKPALADGAGLSAHHRRRFGPGFLFHLPEQTDHRRGHHARGTGRVLLQHRHHTAR